MQISKFAASCWDKLALDERTNEAMDSTLQYQVSDVYVCRTARPFLSLFS